MAGCTASGLEHGHRVERADLPDREVRGGKAGGEHDDEQAGEYREIEIDRNPRLLERAVRQADEERREDVARGGAGRGLAEDHMVDLAVPRADRLQRAVFAQVRERARVDRLPDDGAADDEGEDRGEEERHPEPGLDGPVTDAP